MGITYAWVDYVFDAPAWSRAIKAAYEQHGDDLAEMIGVTPSAIKRYIRMDYSGGFAYPNMTNFLALCNLIDLVPSEFFRLEEC